VEGLSGRYLRRSLPPLGLLAGIGLLGIAVHPGTLLRLVAALPEAVVTAARRNACTPTAMAGRRQCGADNPDLRDHGRRDPAPAATQNGGPGRVLLYLPDHSV
jgi:hypothetical protein